MGDKAADSGGCPRDGFLRASNARLVWCGLLLLLVLLPAAGQGASRRFALLVAHPDGGPGTERLQYAERDARKLGAVLEELGGFARSDVTYLFAPDAAALLAGLQGLEQRAQAVVGRGESALLVFFYSGHATAEELRLGRSRLPLTELRRFFREQPGTIRIALLDACQSGALTRLKGGQRAPSFLLSAEAQPGSSGAVLITSSSANEASQESEELRGSFFTHYLVSGLRGAADRTGDGQVTLGEAYEYSYDRTVAHTAATRSGTQHPTYAFELTGQGTVVLTRLAGAATLVFPATLTGEFLVYDPRRDQVVAEVQLIGGAARQLSVPAGRYVIRQREADQLLLQTLEVPVGQPRVIRPEQFAAVPFEDDVTKGPLAVVRRRTQVRGIGLTVQLGGQLFFDAPTRAELFPATPLFGVRLEGHNLAAPALSLHLDVAFGQAASTLALPLYPEQPLAVDFRLWIAGFGLSWDLRSGDWLLRCGPRLSGVYAQRAFPAAPGLPDQDLFTFSPGLELGLYRAWGGFQAGTSLRAHYLRYATTAEDRSLGFGEAFVLFGYELFSFGGRP